MLASDSIFAPYTDFALSATYKAAGLGDYNGREFLIRPTKLFLVLFKNLKHYNVG